MGIKIKKISVKNFKLFNDLETITFDNPSLVVLDGPNGFGKTSYYDAIEVLFTGSLRRYSSLSNVIDGRSRINDNPILCNKASIEDDMIIKIELEINGNIHYLMRKQTCRELINNINFDTFSIPLYSLTNFESNDGVLIGESKSYFNNLLGIDFNKNFGFLNYIEQEDNTYLLKRKDTDKRAGISHLFDTKEIELKIKKLESVRDKLNEGCNPSSKTSYENILNEKNQYIANLLTNCEESEYFRLLNEKEKLWDKMELDFTSDNYIQWLGTEGELNKLIFFITNFKEFEKKIYNEKLDKLVESKIIIKDILTYNNFIPRSEELKRQFELDNKTIDYLNNFEKGILEAFKNKKIDIPNETEEIFKKFINIEKYKDEVLNINDKLKTSTKLETLLNSVKESRSNFLSNFNEYNKDRSETLCPLCGNDWKEKEKLLDSFNNQAIVLDELISNNGEELSSLLDSFNKEFTPLFENLKKYLSENKIDKDFINKLLEIKKKESSINDLLEKFKELDIDISTHFNIEVNKIPNLENAITNIKENISKKKFLLNEENLKDYFPNYYLNYFDENKSNLLTVEQLNAKKKYINWKYNSYQNTEIQRLETEYNSKKNLYDNSLDIKKKVSKIIKIYKDELKEYQEKLIKDIEILFHIYSGRIMQDYQNGLGLFIKADAIGIRFIESVKIDDTTNLADYNKYDAIFSMSSGQLATLVISFTLALNKRYSKSKLLFIDDPVQTLDELNIAGFVNLLRNEFSDRQIFMSTHEQMMSAYMRYKFEKFNLKTEQINFKEKYIE